MLCRGKRIMIGIRGVGRMRTPEDAPCWAGEDPYYTRRKWRNKKNKTESQADKKKRRKKGRK